MPRIKSTTETMPVNVRLPVELVQRVDKLATDLHTTRTFILSMMLSSSLEVVERVLQPSQWFKDPRLIDMMEEVIKKGFDNVQEEPKQPSKAKA